MCAAVNRNVAPYREPHYKGERWNESLYRESHYKSRGWNDEAVARMKSRRIQVNWCNDWGVDEEKRRRIKGRGGGGKGRGD